MDKELAGMRARVIAQGLMAQDKEKPRSKTIVLVSAQPTPCELCGYPAKAHNNGGHAFRPKE